MKQVHYAGRSLFMHDDTADALIDYARVLSEHRSADAVPVPAVSAEGNPVTVTLLLNEAAAFVVESVAGGITIEPIRMRSKRLNGALDSLRECVAGPPMSHGPSSCRPARHARERYCWPMKALRTAGIWAAVIAAITTVLGILVTELVSLLAAVLGAVVKVVPNLSGPAGRR